jgi:hypothetical protein
MLRRELVAKRRAEAVANAEASLSCAENNPLMIKRMGYASLLGRRCSCRYYFYQWYRVYETKRSLRNRIAAIYIRRFFRRWNKALKKSARRKKRLIKYKAHLMRHKLRRVLVHWQVCIRHEVVTYRSFKTAGRIQAIINGTGPPGPSKKKYLGLTICHKIIAVPFFNNPHYVLVPAPPQKQRNVIRIGHHETLPDITTIGGLPQTACQQNLRKRQANVWKRCRQFKVHAIISLNPRAGAIVEKTLKRVDCTIVIHKITDDRFKTLEYDGGDSLGMSGILFVEPPGTGKALRNKHGMTIVYVFDVRDSFVPKHLNHHAHNWQGRSSGPEFSVILPIEDRMLYNNILKIYQKHSEFEAKKLYSQQQPIGIFSNDELTNHAFMTCTGGRPTQHWGSPQAFKSKYMNKWSNIQKEWSSLPLSLRQTRQRILDSLPHAYVHIIDASSFEDESFFLNFVCHLKEYEGAGCKIIIYSRPEWKPAYIVAVSEKLLQGTGGANAVISSPKYVKQLLNEWELSS